MFLPLTPIRFLHRAMDLFGKSVGVVCGSKQFTYAEFGDRAERLAAALRASGIGKGDRVAFLSFNNHQLLEGYYGVPMTGAMVTPLNVRLTPPELQAILHHAQTSVLFYETEFAPLVEKLRPACPCVGQWMPLNEEYEELLARATPERTDFTAIDENSIAELFYTSGSTGTPKGVALSHRTLYLHGLSVALCYGKLEGVVDLHTIPLFHANGWGRPQVCAMMGTKQVMVRRFDPPSVLKLIEEHRATHMSLVPTMANAMLNCPDLGRHDVSSLREIMLGGAASSPELIERLERAFHCRCYAGYGLTETSPVITVSHVKRDVPLPSDAERFRRQAMAGWPVQNVEIRVVDSHLQDVPHDMTAIGEVVVRSDHVMDAYYLDPQGTASAMENGWLHTGDMAVWDEYSFIHIVDRKKEIIVSGGENISSIEVERAVFAHPEVLECSVIAAPDDRWGEVPAAIVVRKPGSTLTEQALLEFVGERVARFKMPRIVEFREEPLPKTGTGKVRKVELKERYWQGREKRVQG